MATGKDKDDMGQLDGVAEGADNPADNVAEGQDDSSAKRLGKGGADAKKKGEIDEDSSSGDKGKGSRK